MDKRDNPTDLGMNRTGLGTAPVESKRMLDDANKFMPATVDGNAIETVRVELSRSAPPLGHMPPPPTIKGMAKAVLDKLKGGAPMVLLDKLGERLAFERTGVRLYQALMAKWEASSQHEGRPDRRELERIATDELRHFALLERAIEQLGADPTVVTPCADATAVASSGILLLLGDPRATLSQCLSAMLMVELTDNDSWRTLVQLARELGHDELGNEFAGALEEEDEHLVLVRGWVQSSVFGQAGVEPPPVEPLRPSP